MSIVSHTKVGRCADGLAHEPLRTKQMEKLGYMSSIFFPLTTPQYRAGNAGRRRKEISKETAGEVFSELPCPLGHKDLCTSNDLEFSTPEWSGGWLGWRGLAWWFALGYREIFWGCSLVYFKGRCEMNGFRDFKASFLLSETCLAVADWVFWKPSALSLQGLISCITDVAPLTPGTPLMTRDGQAWLTALLHDFFAF